MIIFNFFILVHISTTTDSFISIITNCIRQGYNYASMIKKLANETWKSLNFPGWRQLRNRYAISDMGRIASFREDVEKDGKLLMGSLTTGYRTLNLHRP